MNRIIIAVMLSVALCSCAGAVNNNPDKENFNKAEEFINELTVEEKVGQLFYVRCNDNEIDEILQKNPGGLVMFGVDFENLTYDEAVNKISSYREKSKYPLFIAVDEEGGTVVRVSSNPNLSEERFKSPREYYSEGGIEAVINAEEKKSAVLADLGINMNLAPVADISDNPEDFIYSRSMSGDAGAVSDFVSRAVAAMHSNGVMSCLKHFPGYGNNVDTHNGIAVDERPLESFEAADFLPFKAGIAAQTDAVLVSHNIMTAVDDTQPASISPAVHNILRNDLGFGGIIITDDMSMGAMQDYGTPYVKAVLAGNNMIIVSDFETAYNEVLSAVWDGTISEEVLNSALKPAAEIKAYNFD